MVKALALERAVPSSRALLLRTFLTSELLDQMRVLWCAHRLMHSVLTIAHTVALALGITYMGMRPMIVTHTRRRALHRPFLAQWVRRGLCARCSL